MYEYQVNFLDISINEEADLIIEANSFEEVINNQFVKLIGDKYINYIKKL